MQSMEVSGRSSLESDLRSQCAVFHCLSQFSRVSRTLKLLRHYAVIGAHRITNPPRHIRSSTHQVHIKHRHSSLEMPRVPPQAAIAPRTVGQDRYHTHPSPTYIRTRLCRPLRRDTKLIKCRGR